MGKRALTTPPSGLGTSRGLSPNEHLRMLIELLRPAGPEQARRLVAALMMVPRAERERLVGEIERRVVETYGRERKPSEVTVVGAPVQRDGYVEQVHTTYEVVREVEREDGERRRDVGAG